VPPQANDSIGLAFSLGVLYLTLIPTFMIIICLAKQCVYIFP
jgi:hypothetical protein